MNYNDDTRPSKWKALKKTVNKHILPKIVNVFLPGCGAVLDLAQAYRDELATSNSKMLIDELRRRIDDVEERLSNIDDGQVAEAIEKAFLMAIRDRSKEKMGFYAGLIAGEILGTEFDWDRELREEFDETIADLSRSELMILQAMHNRKRGEVIALSTKGGNWLSQQIKMNEITMAWIDSLVKKGLVIDASIEKVKTGFSSSGARSVKSRSAVSLSTFARIMIDYMLKVLETNI